MRRCNASQMEKPLAATDPATDTTPILPALEPAGHGSGEHKRSFATARVIMALMLREMTTKYGQSPGGYIWAILEPVGMIIVLAFGFGLMMRSPSLGSSFIVFYASGYLPFNQYRTLEKVITKAIPFSRGLLRYPAVTWLDAILARFLLNMLTNVLNSILIMWGAIYFTSGNMIVELAPIVEAMMLAAFLALGLGTLNALLMGVWSLWSPIYKIITRPLLRASAVLYLLDDLPTPVMNILWYNPLVHLTGLMRTGIFISYNPQYISVPYVVLVAMVSLAVGLLFLRVHALDVVADE